MSFEMTVPFHCPLCRQECEQAAPNVPVWRCAGCDLVIRVGVAQLTDALLRFREGAGADLERKMKAVLPPSRRTGRHTFPPPLEVARDGG